jgi:DNA-binding transcriptional LysR family regulator
MMYDGLEFRHLLSFVTVAEECSFGKAAERLKISQPALSHQIKQLENGLRAILFIRTQLGVTLTRSGAKFLVFARKMLHMWGDAVRATSSDQAGTEWPLRLGYTPFADHKVIDQALIGYSELVPGGHIQTSSECSAELATMVADGRLDAAIVSFPVMETHPAEAMSREAQDIARYAAARGLVVTAEADPHLLEPELPEILAQTRPKIR